MVEEDDFLNCKLLCWDVPTKNISTKDIPTNVARSSGKANAIVNYKTNAAVRIHIPPLLKAPRLKKAYIKKMIIIK